MHERNFSQRQQLTAEQIFGPGSQIEIVPFNPANSTGLEDESVVINGIELPVHPTNNMQMIIGIYFRLQDGKPNGPFEEIYKSVFQENHLSEIIEKYRQQRPNLFRCMEEVSRDHLRKADERNEARGRFGNNSEAYQSVVRAQEPTPEEVNRRKYVFSMAYDALAESAKVIDPYYDLTRLRVLTGTSTF